MEKGKETTEGGKLSGSQPSRVVGERRNKAHEGCAVFTKQMQPECKGCKTPQKPHQNT